MATRGLRRAARGASSFSGIRELQENVARVLDATSGKKIKQVYMDAGTILRDEARRNAPFDPKRESGFHLRDAIFVDEGAAEKSNVIVGVQSVLRGTKKLARAPHAHLMEFGFHQRDGKFNPGKPFMRPAITSTKAEIRTALKSGLIKIVEEAPR